MSNNKPVIESLKHVLADTYMIYSKTQNYHWNVESANFMTLHEMFEKQYRALAEAVDAIAERIRTLGEKTPSVKNLLKNYVSIKDADSDFSDKEMIKDLLTSHQALIKVLRNTEETAAKAEDSGTEDFVVQRIQEHEKTAWMLRSSITQK